MKTLILAVLLVISQAMCVSADERDGNWWTAQKTVAKTFYVAGLLDGLNTSERIVQRNTPAAYEAYTDAADELFLGRTAGQLVEGLNVFFKDYRNRAIDVSDALIVCGMESSGAEQHQIDEAVSFLRQSASSPRRAAGNRSAGR